jgi:hypothetical protein
MVLTVAALMAAMGVSAGPAKADLSGNENDFENGFNAVQIGDNDDSGVFDGFGDNDFLDNFFGFGDDDVLGFGDDELDTIDVGDDVECLVEDGDDIDFCVNEETGDIFNV